MKKLLLVLSVMSLASFRATADDSLVTFDGGIGVDPVSGITSNAAALNVVRGIPPGGFPWVIKRLRADVRVDGRIHVDGRGLLLSGGNVLEPTAVRRSWRCCSAGLLGRMAVSGPRRLTARIPQESRSR